MLGSCRGYGGGGSEPDSAVSLSSTAHKKTVHKRNVCVRECVNARARVCVYVESLCGLCFSLYRWCCPFVCVPGSVSFLHRGGLVMHWQGESG